MQSFGANPFETLTREFGEFYANANHNPASVDYTELTRVIFNQYHKIPVRVVFSDLDKYACDSQAMFDDIRYGFLHVWNGARPGKGHPLSFPVSSKLCLNDMFRATHDYYGHYIHTLSFSRNSELLLAKYYGRANGLLENDALLCETVCQTAFFHNSGKQFGEQKVCAIPSELKKLWLRFCDATR